MIIGREDKQPTTARRLWLTLRKSPHDRLRNLKQDPINDASYYPNDFKETKLRTFLIKRIRLVVSPNP